MARPPPAAQFLKSDRFKGKIMQQFKGLQRAIYGMILREVAAIARIMPRNSSYGEEPNRSPQGMSQ
jgi:hypothetical protein